MSLDKARSVLITGASKGFGLELLKVFGDAGWRIFPLVRDESAIEKVIIQFEGRCHPIVGDVCKDTVCDAIQSVLGENGSQLDLLINNAGNIEKNRWLNEASPNDMVNHFQVHCTGVVRCVKSSLPYLRKSDYPIIVNISSRWGSMTATAAGQCCGIYAYQIAKAAQNMLTLCLRHELSQENMKVFAVHPGRLQTSVAAPDADTPPELAAQKLYDFVQSADNYPNGKMIDLMGDGVLDW